MINIDDVDCNIDAILKYHLRKESAKENSLEPSPSSKESDKENTSKPSPSRKETAEENTSKPSPSRKENAKENTSKPPPTKDCFEDKTKRTSQENSDPYKTNLNSKKLHVMKQGEVKKNMLEYVIV